MSKNPPKPNTSPDHVKETAETLTRPSSARPEHGPSHTEARERLADTLRLALERKPEGARTLSIHLPVDAAEALLATPTQEGVGREEIARIIDPRAFNEIPAPLTRFKGMSYTDPENGHHVWDTKDSGICSSNGPDSRAPWPKLASREEADAAAERLNNEPRQPYLRRQEDALAKANAILSLLPDPKPGEGADTRVCRVCDGGPGNECQCACGLRLYDPAKPQQPAPGAPEGWREALSEIVALTELPSPPKIIPAVERLFNIRLVAEAALTPSSAKPQIQSDKSASDIEISSMASSAKPGGDRD